MTTAVAVCLYWLPVKRSVVDLAIESRLKLVESMAFVRLDFCGMARRFEEGLKTALRLSQGWASSTPSGPGLSLGRLRPRRACVCFTR